MTNHADTPKSPATSELDPLAQHEWASDIIQEHMRFVVASKAKALTDAAGGARPTHGIFDAVGMRDLYRQATSLAHPGGVWAGVLEYPKGWPPGVNAGVVNRHNAFVLTPDANATHRALSYRSLGDDGETLVFVVPLAKRSAFNAEELKKLAHERSIDAIPPRPEGPPSTDVEQWTGTLPTADRASAWWCGCLGASASTEEPARLGYANHIDAMACGNCGSKRNSIGTSTAEERQPGRTVEDSPSPTHAARGGHARQGETPAAGNVAESQPDPSGTVASGTRLPLSQDWRGELQSALGWLYRTFEFERHKINSLKPRPDEMRDVVSLAQAELHGLETGAAVARQAVQQFGAVMADLSSDAPPPGVHCVCQGVLCCLCGTTEPAASPCPGPVSTSERQDDESPTGPCPNCGAHAWEDSPEDPDESRWLCNGTMCGYRPPLTPSDCLDGADSLGTFTLDGERFKDGDEVRIPIHPAPEEVAPEDGQLDPNVCDHAEVKRYSKDNGPWFWACKACRARFATC